MNVNIDIPQDFLNKVEGKNLEQLKAMQQHVIDWLAKRDKKHPNFFAACKQLTYLTILVIRNGEPIDQEAKRSANLQATKDPLIENVVDELFK